MVFVWDQILIIPHCLEIRFFNSSWKKTKEHEQIESFRIFSFEIVDWYVKRGPHWPSRIIRLLIVQSCKLFVNKLLEELNES